MGCPKTRPGCWLALLRGWCLHPRSSCPLRLWEAAEKQATAHAHLQSSLVRSILQACCHRQVLKRIGECLEAHVSMTGSLPRAQ